MITHTYGSSPQPSACRFQHAVFRLQPEVTRPKARFKRKLPEKSEVDGEAVRYEHALNSLHRDDIKRTAYHPTTYIQSKLSMTKQNNNSPCTWRSLNPSCRRRCTWCTAFCCGLAKSWETCTFCRKIRTKTFRHHLRRNSCRQSDYEVQTFWRRNSFPSLKQFQLFHWVIHCFALHSNIDFKDIKSVDY